MKQSKVLAFSNSNYEVSSDELQSTLRLGAYHKSPDIEQIFAGNIGQLRQLVEGMGLNGV